MTKELHELLPNVMNVMNMVYKMRWREKIEKQEFRDVTYFPYRVLNRLPGEAKYCVMFWHNGYFKYFEEVNSFRVYKKVVIDVYDLVNKTDTLANKIKPITDKDILTTKFLVTIHNPYWFQTQIQETGIADLMIIAYSDVIPFDSTVVAEEPSQITPKIPHHCESYIRFKQNLEPAKQKQAYIQLGFTFYTGEVTRWQTGIATQAKNLDNLDAIASHIIVVPANGPNYVFILFKDDLPANVKVILTEDHFVSTDKATIADRVGPGFNSTLSVMYTLRQFAPRENDTIVHIVVYPEEEESLPFRFHIFGVGCYHYSKKTIEAGKFEEKWWDGSSGNAKEKMCDVIIFLIPTAFAL